MTRPRVDSAPLAPRRVALFLNALPGGGAERNLLALGRLLSERDHPVDLVLAERRGALLSEVPEALRIVELGSRGSLPTAAALARLPPGSRGAALRMLQRHRLVRSLIPLVDYLRRGDPAALITTLPKNALLTLWARCLAGSGVRVVVREANTFSIEAAKGTGRSDALLTGLARRWYRRADAIVAVSAGVAADLVRSLELPAERITTIYNAVDAVGIVRRAAEPLEDAWFRPGSPPVLLSAGRLSRQKDYPTLLRAFVLLRRERALRLMVLGEGSQRAHLDGLCRTLGIEADVQFPGFVPNPHAYMARAAAFVLSSAWEGFPNVLIEALACGCPVVSTDCPHGPSEILGGGRFGGLAPPGNPEALAEAIAETLDAPADPDRLRARAREFSPERMFDGYRQAIFPDASSAALRP